MVSDVFPCFGILVAGTQLIAQVLFESPSQKVKVENVLRGQTEDLLIFGVFLDLTVKASYCQLRSCSGDKLVFGFSARNAPEIETKDPQCVYPSVEIFGLVFVSLISMSTHAPLQIILVQVEARSVVTKASFSLMQKLKFQPTPSCST